MSSTLNSTAHFHIWVINILQKYSRVSSDYPRVLSWFHNSHIFLLWNAHPCWFSPLPLFSSVAQLCLTLCDPMVCGTPGFPVYHPTPRACSNSCPSSQWCYPNISSSVIPFYSCPQSFPASGSFPVSQFFASGDPSIGVSASTSVLPMNIQDSFPLEWTGWISLQSKGLSRVFSNTIVQKHQFFGAQLSL